MAEPVIRGSEPRTCYFFIWVPITCVFTLKLDHS